jgi:hypothetical protein
LAHDFSGFGPMISWPYCLWVCGEADHCSMSVWQETLNSWQQESREQERNGPGSQYPFKGTPQ